MCLMTRRCQWWPLLPALVAIVAAAGCARQAPPAEHTAPDAPAAADRGTHASDTASSNAASPGAAAAEVPVVTPSPMPPPPPPPAPVVTKPRPLDPLIASVQKALDDRYKMDGLLRVMRIRVVDARRAMLIASYRKGDENTGAVGLDLATYAGSRITLREYSCDTDEPTLPRITVAGITQQESDWLTNMNPDGTMSSLSPDILYYRAPRVGDRVVYRDREHQPLNIRSAHDLSAPVIGRLPYASEVQVLAVEYGVRPGWIRGRAAATDQTGWMAFRSTRGFDQLLHPK